MRRILKQQKRRKKKVGVVRGNNNKKLYTLRDNICMCFFMYIMYWLDYFSLNVVIKLQERESRFQHLFLSYS